MSLSKTLVKLTDDVSADFRSPWVATADFRLVLIDVHVIAISSGNFTFTVEIATSADGAAKTQESTAAISATGHTYLDINENGKDGDNLGAFLRGFVDIGTATGLTLEVTAIFK